MWLVAVVTQDYVVAVFALCHSFFFCHLHTTPTLPPALVAFYVQTANDPASDLLYSNNYALHALHEAASATGDQKLRNATMLLRDFILRSQVSTSTNGRSSTSSAGSDSSSLPKLAGSWLRSFDFERWEYYAQGSDLGWGPWVAETGHGSSLITMTLAVMAKGTSMWDVVVAKGMSKRFTRLYKELAPLYLPVADAHGL
jgi:hypothetical protein